MVISMFLDAYYVYIIFGYRGCYLNWFTVFKVLTSNVSMLTMLLHLSNFGLGFGTVGDFGPDLQPQQNASLVYLHEE